MADLAVPVAHHDQRTEAEALAALDDLGDAVDEDNLVDQLFLVIVDLFESSQFTTSLPRTSIRLRGPHPTAP